MFQCVTKTYAGLLIIVFSFTPSKYKNGLTKTLVDRCYKLSNTWIGFDSNLEDLTKILNKSQFPTKFIYRVSKKYLDLKLDKRPLEKNTDVKADTRFFKLPYFGKYSNIAQKKIQNLAKIFFKGIDVKVVLTPFRISNKLSYKDPLQFQFHLQSFIVYKFICVNCKVCYVVWVKPQGTSSTESMNTYRKTLCPISLNICKIHVHL